jgi:hypothetical protein
VLFLLLCCCCGVVVVVVVVDVVDVLCFVVLLCCVVIVGAVVDVVAPDSAALARRRYHMISYVLACFNAFALVWASLCQQTPPRHTGTLANTTLLHSQCAHNTVAYSKPDMLQSTLHARTAHCL